MTKDERQKTKIGLYLPYAVPAILESIGADWDWIWIDGQHGQFGYTDMISMVRTCDFIQRPAFVRVPSQDKGWVSQALDMKADAVIVPQIDNVEQAQAMVSAAKFPPVGNRSFGGRRVIDLMGRNYASQANTATLLVCQIESPESIDNVDAIAATPGVDALFFGPDDYFLRKGHIMGTPLPLDQLEATYSKVITACRNHSKIAITSVGSLETLALANRQGFDYICAGTVSNFLAQASSLASANAREAVLS